MHIRPYEGGFLSLVLQVVAGVVIMKTSLNPTKPLWGKAVAGTN